jgi:hypothetical protein
VILILRRCICPILFFPHSSLSPIAYQHSAPIIHLKWSPLSPQTNGSLLLSCDTAGVIILWEIHSRLDSLKAIRVFEEFRGSSPIKSVSWHGTSDDVWVNGSLSQKVQRYQVDENWYTSTYVRSFSDGGKNPDDVVASGDVASAPSLSPSGQILSQLFGNEVS